MPRALFIACGVYNWDPTDPKNATFSFTDGGPRVSIDSTKRPEGGLAVEGAIVDDVLGGASSVVTKGDKGALYVEEGYAHTYRYPSLPDGYQAYADREYEFRTIQYSTKDAMFPGRRYYGFHAIWMDGDASAASLLIFDAGASRTTFPSRAVQVVENLANAEMFLPITDAGYPFPVRGDASGGCLFIRCREAKGWKLSIPKIPQILGGVALKCPAGDKPVNQQSDASE